MIPHQFAVKFWPPQLCLIYQYNKQKLFHEFPLDPSSLHLTSQGILHLLNSSHPGYFQEIDPKQIIKLLDLIKSKQKLKHLVKDPKYLTEIEVFSSGPEDEHIDFTVIDQELPEDSGSDSSLQF